MLFYEQNIIRPTSKCHWYVKRQWILYPNRLSFLNKVFCFLEVAAFILVDAYFCSV